MIILVCLWHRVTSQYVTVHHMTSHMSHDLTWLHYMLQYITWHHTCHMTSHDFTICYSTSHDITHVTWPHMIPQYVTVIILVCLWHRVTSPSKLLYWLLDVFYLKTTPFSFRGAVSLDEGGQDKALHTYNKYPINLWGCRWWLPCTPLPKYLPGSCHSKLPAQGRWPSSLQISGGGLKQALPV